MGRPLIRPVRLAAAAVLAALSLGIPALAQPQATLFTTKDYRQDRDRWTDPAYYLHNTARELTDMQVDNRFAQKGSGKDEFVIKSPYAFSSSGSTTRHG